MAKLILLVSLTSGDVTRLSAFMSMLVVGPEQQVESNTEKNNAH